MVEDTEVDQVDLNSKRGRSASTQGGKEAAAVDACHKPGISSTPDSSIKIGKGVQTTTTEKGSSNSDFAL